MLRGAFRLFHRDFDLLACSTPPLAAFGIAAFSTPFSKFAAILSTSAFSGRRKLRLNAP